MTRERRQQILSVLMLAAAFLVLLAWTMALHGQPTTAPTTQPATQPTTRVTDANGFTVWPIDPSGRTCYLSANSNPALGPVGDDHNSGLTPDKPIRTTKRAFGSRNGTVYYGGVLRGPGFADRLLIDASGGEITDTQLSQIPYGGPDDAHRLLVTSSSPTSRPVIRTAGISNSASNIAFANLILIAATKDPDGPAFNRNSALGTVGLSVAGAMANVTIEGCSFRYFAEGVDVHGLTSPTTGAVARPSNIVIRRNVIADSYSLNSGHPCGIFAGGVDGLLVEQNDLLHCGWSEDPRILAPAAITNHALYLSDAITNCVVRDNRIWRASSHGAQLRSGGTLADNLIVDCPYGAFLAAAGGTASGNVILGGATMAGNPAAHGGLEAVQAANVSFTGNIIAHNGQANQGPAIQLSPTPKAGQPVPMVASVLNNTIWDWQGNAVATNGPVALTTGNNVVLATKGGMVQLWPPSQPFADPTRDLAGYAASLGLDLPTFLARVRENWSGNFDPALMPSAALAWIRAGYAPAAIAPQSIPIRMGDGTVIDIGVKPVQRIDVRYTDGTSATVPATRGSN